MRLGKNVAWSTLIAAAAAVVMLCATQGAMAAITSSAHDFSGNAWSGGQICVVCHAPHNNNNAAGGLLWNHAQTNATFVLYSSPTLNNSGQTVGGVSKLCLSCHDGTVAIDSFGGTTGGNLLTGSKKVGPDLSNDHPIGFTYDAALATADGALATPASASLVVANVPLYAAKLECASCHDVHNGANISKLLRTTNAGSALCLKCHTK